MAGCFVVSSSAATALPRCVASVERAVPNAQEQITHLPRLFSPTPLSLAAAAAAFATAARGTKLPKRTHRVHRRVSAQEQMTTILTTDTPSDERLQSLQGQWEDNVGRTIEVEGAEAFFNDGTGPWKIKTENGALVLRGAALVVDEQEYADDQPAWRYPTGAELIWSRPTPVAPEDLAWSKIFHDYKLSIHTSRLRLWAALAAEDYATAAKVRDEPQVPFAEATQVSPELHFRLMTGRGMSPGVVFRHRVSGVRGVIVCAEPWYNAPLARRLDGKGGSVDMKLQPFYHCLIDERDSLENGGAMVVEGDESGSAAFLRESEIELDPSSYPLVNGLIPRLFVHCEELQGYLPSPLLQEAMYRHREGEPFAV